MQDPVTWYRINYAGTQVTQWDFQNKGKSGWTGTSSFVLQVPLCNLYPSIIDSVPCDRIVQRAYCSCFFSMTWKKTSLCYAITCHKMSYCKLLPGKLQIDELTTFGRIIFHVSRKIVKVKQMRAGRFFSLAGRDSCPLPSSLMIYHKCVSNSSHNSVRLATSRLRKCESERVSRGRKRGTKSRVDLFRLPIIELNLHIVGANKTGCDVNI